MRLHRRRKIFTTLTLSAGLLLGLTGPAVAAAPPEDPSAITEAGPPRAADPDNQDEVDLGWVQLQRLYEQPPSAQGAAAAAASGTDTETDASAGEVGDEDAASAPMSVGLYGDSMISREADVIAEEVTAALEEAGYDDVAVTDEWSQSGATTSEVLAGTEDALAEHVPDAALVWAGGNDSFQGDTAGMQGRMQDIVDTLCEAGVSSVVYARNHTLLDQGADQGIVEDVNPAVDELTAPTGCSLALADMRAVDVSEEMADDLHPTAAGIALQSQEWSSALLSALEDTAPTSATTGGGSGSRAPPGDDEVTGEPAEEPAGEDTSEGSSGGLDEEERDLLERLAALLGFGEDSETVEDAEAAGPEPAERGDATTGDEDGASSTARDEDDAGGGEAAVAQGAEGGDDDESTTSGTGFDARGVEDGDAVDQDGAASSGTWSSGATFLDAENVEAFSEWRGTPATITGVFADRGDENQRNLPMYTALEGWTGDVDLALGMITEDESMAAAADGAYTERWVEAAQTINENWGEKDTVYVRVAHEMNGTWFAWSVTEDNAADFRSAFCDYYGILHEENPEKDLEVVFGLNADPANGMAIEDYYPGDECVDVMGVDKYDAWPSLDNEEEWDAWWDDTKNGSPLGLGAHLAFAADHGKSLGLGEWGASNDQDGGPRDNPFFVERMYEAFAAHAGTGPGQIEYDVYFNTWDQIELFPNTQIPKVADAYRQLDWGLAS